MGEVDPTKRPIALLDGAHRPFMGPARMARSRAVEAGPSSSGILNSIRVEF
jgi:hypothetical protein